MLHHLSDVFSLFQSPAKHFIMQPFGVSVGLHGPSTDRWGTSMHQEGEEERGNAEKKTTRKLMKQPRGRKNVRVRESLTGGRKHRDGVGGCREDDGFIITQALLISTVCTIGRRNLHSLFLDAHAHTSS